MDRKGELLLFDYPALQLKESENVSDLYQIGGFLAPQLAGMAESLQRQRSRGAVEGYLLVSPVA